MTERVFTIADVDGGPMIITPVDGVVATMMWGETAYVDIDRAFRSATRSTHRRALSARLERRARTQTRHPLD